MKKYENFCASLKNMKEIYDYDEPYNTVVLTGLVGLYEICFEQSWKMMKEILEIHGYEEGATGSPKIILRTAYRAGMIKNEDAWLIAFMRILYCRTQIPLFRSCFFICFLLSSFRVYTRLNDFKNSLLTTVQIQK